MEMSDEYPQFISYMTLEEESTWENEDNYLLDLCNETDDDEEEKEDKTTNEESEETNAEDLGFRTVQCSPKELRKRRTFSLKKFEQRLLEYRNQLVERVPLTRQNMKDIKKYSIPRRFCKGIDALHFPVKPFRSKLKQKTAWGSLFSDLPSLSVQCLSYAIEQRNLRELVVDVMGDSLVDVMLPFLDTPIRYSVAIALGYLVEYGLELSDPVMNILAELLELHSSLLTYPMTKEYFMTSLEMDFITLRFRAMRSIQTAVKNNSPLNDTLLHSLKRYVTDIRSDTSFYISISIGNPEDYEKKRNFFSKSYRMVKRGVKRLLTWKKEEKNATILLNDAGKDVRKLKKIFKNLLPNLIFTSQQTDSNLRSQIVELTMEQTETEVDLLKSLCLSYFHWDNGNREGLDEMFSTLFETLYKSDPICFSEIKSVKKMIKYRLLTIYSLLQFTKSHASLVPDIKKVFIQFEKLFEPLRILADEMLLTNYLNAQGSRGKEESESTTTQNTSVIFSANPAQIQSKIELVAKLIDELPNLDVVKQKKISQSLLSQIDSLPRERCEFPIGITDKLILYIHEHNYVTALNAAEIFNKWILKIRWKRTTLSQHLPDMKLKLFTEIILKSKLLSLKRLLLETISVISKDISLPGNYLFLYDCFEYEYLKFLVLQTTRNMLLLSPQSVKFDETFLKMMSTIFQSKSSCDAPECQCKSIKAKELVCEILMRVKQDHSHDTLLKIIQIIWRENNKHLVKAGCEFIEEKFNCFGKEIRELLNILLKIETSQIEWTREQLPCANKHRLFCLTSLVLQHDNIVMQCTEEEVKQISHFIALRLQNDSNVKKDSDLLAKLKAFLSKREFFLEKATVDIFHVYQKCEELKTKNKSDEEIILTIQQECYFSEEDLKDLLPIEMKRTFQMRTEFTRRSSKNDLSAEEIKCQFQELNSGSTINTILQSYSNLLEMLQSNQVDSVNPRDYIMNTDLQTNIHSILVRMALYAKRGTCDIVKSNEIRLPQYLSVISMILKNEKIGRICQVATGEGKSLIIAFLAIILALRGYYVDIVTSSEILAKRDVKLFNDLYMNFGVKCSENSDDNYSGTGVKQCYLHQLRQQCHPVVYGSIRNFQFDVLRHEFFSLKTRGERKFSCVIIDEIDNVLVDEGTNIAMLSSLTPGMNYLDGIFLKIWSFLSSRDELSEDDLQEVKQEVQHSYNSQEICEEFSVEYLNGQRNSELSVPHHLKNYVESKLDVWISNAQVAKQKCHLNVHYTIEEGQIKIVDYKNTGNVFEDSRWTDGLHRFLELKHHLKLKQESLPTNFCSNMQFIKRYGVNIYGFTGTVGSKYVQDFLYQQYNLDCIMIPRFRGKVFVEKTSLVCTNLEDWENEIIKSLKDYLNRQSRAVLIVTQSISHANYVHKLIKRFDVNIRQLSLYISNEKRHHQIIKHSVQMHDVIIATNLAGRGADFSVANDVEINGGLHVLVTFSPTNSRIKEQIFGRTSRQGNSGSGQIICRSNDELINNNELQTLNHYITTEIPLDQLKHELFLEYCHMREEIIRSEVRQMRFKKIIQWQAVRLKRMLHYKIKSLDKQWAMWITMNLQNLPKSIWNNFDEFQRETHFKFQTFQEELRKSSNDQERTFKNPFYYVGYANDLLISLEKNMWCIGQNIGLWKSETKEIIVNLDRAVKMDNSLAFYWKYMKACALVNLSTQYLQKDSFVAFTKIQEAFDCLKESQSLLSSTEMSQLQFVMNRYEKDTQGKLTELYAHTGKRLNVLENIDKNICQNMKKVNNSRKYINMKIKLVGQINQKRLESLKTLHHAGTEIDIKYKAEKKILLGILNKFLSPCATLQVSIMLSFKMKKKIYLKIRGNNERIVVLSTREFPSDSVCQELLELSQNPSFDLSDLAQFLEAPHHTEIQFNVKLTKLQDKTAQRLLRFNSNDNIRTILSIRNIFLDNVYEVIHSFKKDEKVHIKFHNLRQVKDMIVFHLRNEVVKIAKEFMKVQPPRNMTIQFQSLGISTALKLLPFYRLHSIKEDISVQSKWKRIINTIKTTAKQRLIDVETNVFQLDGAETVPVAISFSNICSQIFLDFCHISEKILMTEGLMTESYVSQDIAMKILTACSETYQWSDINVTLTFTPTSYEQLKQILYLNDKYLSDSILNLQEVETFHAISMFHKFDLESEIFMRPEIQSIENYLLSMNDFEQLEEWKCNEVKYLFLLSERPPFRAATFVTVTTLAIVQGAIAAGLLASGVGAPVAYQLVSELFSDIVQMGKLYENKFDWSSYFKNKLLFCLSAGCSTLTQPIHPQSFMKLIHKVVLKITKVSAKEFIKYTSDHASAQMKDNEQSAANQNVMPEVDDLCDSHFVSWGNVFDNCHVNSNRKAILFQQLSRKDFKNAGEYKNLVINIINFYNETWPPIDKIHVDISIQSETFIKEMREILIEQIHYYKIKNVSWNKYDLIRFSSKILTPTVTHGVSAIA